MIYILKENQIIIYFFLIYGFEKYDWFVVFYGIDMMMPIKHRT